MAEHVGNLHLQSEAEVYHQTSVVPNEVGHMLLDKLHLKEGDCVLDLGCGTGYMASFMAQKVGPTGKVVAVDPDTERIKVAQQMYRHLENVFILEGSSDNFPAGPYDAVYSNLVFHFVRDKEAAFKNIHSSLKSDGHCIISTYFDLPPLVREFFDLVGPEKSQRFYEKYFFEPIGSYEALASASGLQVVEKLPLSTKLSFPTVDMLFKGAYAATHGLFDPSEVDSKALEEYKARWYRNNSFTAELSSYGAIIIIKKS